ncbi:MAG: phosphate ABC transporter substrate-binding protein PstS [Pleurocapsa sp. SU_5_0]|nr:phosphate ABC transporter substrate-binding protein PstS [Pleurocapsa sp. SU_5_0]NJO96321.1 phosphate ABC transporter substrate-binding protein PstS [Pleurocapsa sp. CRU_1_2]NJR46023.1 phosphate ABC transporter substrate-binding protein PstS [Hyellaceae cyanobacterium CSU_1_1]
MTFKITRRFCLATVSALSLTLLAQSIDLTNNSPANIPAANAQDSGLEASLTGAGASFPAPLYQRWFSEYNKQNPGVEISYQSVGSGAGVEQYLQGTVDFGASDKPLSDEERATFEATYGKAPIQVPMTAGSVVFAYNLPGVDSLELPRQAYCGIANGEITQWNDPAIAQANPNVTLPDTPISWIHRSDGSGTTFLFTSHLQAACPNWQGGADKTVEWTTGVGAKGNEGIAAQIAQTEGGIGYVEYAYAKENGITAAGIENKAGNIILPSPESASLVFEGETIPEDFALTVADPANPQAYPIAGMTWLLLYPEYKDPNTAQVLQGFIDWALNSGDQYSTELGYIPLPKQLEARVLQTVQQEVVAKK